MLMLNNTRINGHNLTVRANFRIDSKELSGQSSATDRSEQGFKPMTLAVSLTIPYDKPGNLTRLVELSRATGSDGKQTVYNIVNNTAKTCKIRQVTFTDNFTAGQDGTLRQWQVNFTLVEYNSVPEKTEQRQEKPAAIAQAADTDSTASTMPPASNRDQQLTGFMKVLKNLDESLA